MLLQRTLFRNPDRSARKIIAVFSFRYDAQLVPALIENIRPLVHGVVSCDDRAATEAMSDEPARRNALHAAARDMEADWILAVDPDERFETGLAARIAQMTSDRFDRVLWVFRLREMFSETAYRTDGIWGGKTQMRLYPAQATLRPLDKTLHGRWIADSTGYRDVQSGLNLYHLRHASPRRTQHRRDTYAAADPGRRHHTFGYDYLADLRGATLREIPAGHGFLPPHVEDHELWAAPKIAAIGDPVPDPPESRLRTIARSLRWGGSDGAAYLAQDSLQADPADADIAVVAASLALRAGRPRDALSIIAATEPDPTLLAQVIKARSLARTGARDAAAEAFALARAQAAGRRIIPHIEQNTLAEKVNFAAHKAQWRRWAGGSAAFHDGAANGTGPLCIIVIGYQAPSSLAAVVAAARAQSDATEIVVVNSGGGDAAALLREHLSRIRLIDVSGRLFVGHARNVGIDASRGDHVSFLADDCVPMPGWVAARIARHDAGALMVASAVVPERPDTVLGHVARTFLFSRRAPTLSEDDALPYGRSYHRSVFADAGYFATGLRIGEDTEFNRRADMLAQPVWAPEIVVRHFDPRSVFGMLRDMQRRAHRFAPHIRPKAASDPARDWVAERVSELRERATVSLGQAGHLGWLNRVWLRIVLGLCIQANRIGFRRADRILVRVEALADQAKTIAGEEPIRAAALLRRAVALTPQDWKLHHALGEALARHDDEASVTQALASFAAASDIAPTEAAPFRARTDLLLRTRPKWQALEVCEAAVIATPQASGILLQAAIVARRINQPTLVTYFAQSGLVADVSNIRAHGLLERLYRENGNSDMAERRRLMAERLRGNTLPRP